MVLANIHNNKGEQYAAEKKTYICTLYLMIFLVTVFRNSRLLLGFVSEDLN